ncbi:MAG: hypothetical protein A2289_19890 [Deltaproteobacteria bacterium RIFOXYA12_FULL_58_15]|nr:MAG: hypothetical protein A2289_19890 [Deltaproteobacteria bacterium RIFOXYA12_FULL_58_15]OGR08892.1 MAG: hypothetical protein A2341_27580 [Deltaproteobacteria bacterium RIFOXYB12_FULL_58_9]
MHPSEADLDTLLHSLVDAGVEFIVVGGAAAILHGAPTATQDLDIVHRRTPENIDRLLAVLERLDAYFREPGERRLRPAKDHLAGGGQLNLSTVLGPIDPLCRLHDGRGFDELAPHTTVFEDGSMRLRVLDLDTLIEIKSGTGRAKDQLLVPVLLALRDELRK